MVCKHLIKFPFSAGMAVLVLAEFIPTPDSSFAQFAEKISQSKKVTLRPEKIEHLFDQHVLEKMIQTAGPKALKHKAVFYQLSMDTSFGTLFPEPPVMRFSHQEKECSSGSRLMAQKTRHKKVFKMTGPLIAHETIMQCHGLWQGLWFVAIAPKGLGGGDFGKDGPANDR